jgi:hypothetical protein
MRERLHIRFWLTIGSIVCTILLLAVSIVLLPQPWSFVALIVVVIIESVAIAGILGILPDILFVFLMLRLIFEAIRKGRR